MSNPCEGDSKTSVPGIKGTNTATGDGVLGSETEPSRTSADLRTEFDSPTFVGASAASSIAISHFEEAYRARPPWDIDGPQPDLARLLDAGFIQGRVLDIGCGTGENALFFASRGIDVTGLDASAVAITRAQAKARGRGLSARFIQGDALQLAALGEMFGAVTDSGLLHVFSDQEMQQVIRGIHAVLRPSGPVLADVLQRTRHAPRAAQAHQAAHRHPLQGRLADPKHRARAVRSDRRTGPRRRRQDRGRLRPPGPRASKGCDPP